MTLVTKRMTVSPGTDEGTGTFDAILSTPSVDREGESLPTHAWKQPLPSRISITTDHTGSVSDVVASGEPYIASDGSLRLKGRFAATEKGQTVRQLVVGGDVTSLSVEFLRSKSADGAPVHELTAASFVLLPANVDAIVLSAKAFDTALKSVLAGEPLLQAIHDASIHLGAACAVFTDDDDMDPTGANKAAALALRLKALGRG